MVKWLYFLVLISATHGLLGQETTLPVDLRQHNLTEFNSSLFNPVFSLDRNSPNAVALWTRWQWQNVDGDPTTLFLSYTHAINPNSAINGGFFQHNTGTFLNTGGIVNYAYRFNLGEKTQLALGLNVFGYQQELSDDRFLPDPTLPLPELQVSNKFIMQFAPGVRLTSHGFGIGLASENLFDYNVTDKETLTQSSDKIYMGTLSYDIPLLFKDALENSFLRPNLYLKTIPNEDTQYGITTLLSTPKFWGQFGYNSFYGISVGGGGRFYKKLSLGALVEFGTKSIIQQNDPSFEFVLAYQVKAKQVEKSLSEEELQQLEEEKLKEKLANEEARVAEREAKKQAKILETQRRLQLKDSLERLKQEKALVLSSQRKEGQRLDSLRRVAENEAIALNRKAIEEKRLDSIRNIALQEAAEKKAAQDKLAQATETEKPKTTGRYEEVANEDGLVPGYYLVANVFGTKKYFDSFMGTLKNKGLNPKSFYRSVNKYNYVYLERYDTLREAEIARDNNFNGQYKETTWIFRVVE